MLEELVRYAREQELDPEPGFKFNQIYEVYSQRFQKDDLDPNEKFDPKTLPSEYLKDPKARDAFVYVCTIQRMTINLFGRQAAYGLGDEDLDEDAEQIDIPIHAFDVVIADECHRGYTTADYARLVTKIRQQIPDVVLGTDIIVGFL